MALHGWTPEERRLLAVLHKFFETSKNETASIFNKIANAGLGVAAIEAQLNDLKRTQRGHIFQYIMSMPLPEARENFREEKNMIEEAAQSLRIELKLRVYARESTLVPPLKRGAVADRDDWSSDSDSSVQVAQRNAANGSGENKRVKTHIAPA